MQTRSHLIIVPVTISLIGSLVWTLTIFSSIEKPWLLQGCIDWFFRFWIHFRIFGSVSEQELLTAAGIIPDWVQFFPHGGGVLFLNLLSLYLPKLDALKPTVGFAVLGASIFILWVWLWWSTKEIRVLMLVVISTVGLFLVWLSPVILTSFFVLPCLLFQRRLNSLIVFASILSLLFLFPSALCIGTTLIALVILLCQKQTTFRVISQHSTLVLLFVLLAVELSNIYWCLNNTSWQLFSDSHASTNRSLDSLEGRVSKQMVDYARIKFKMPRPESGVDRIPIERFRLKKIKDDLIHISYFFSVDWGDSFNYENAPKVTIISGSDLKALRPVWAKVLSDEFSYSLSYTHLGELNIVIPKALFINAYTGLVEIRL